MEALLTTKRRTKMMWDNYPQKSYLQVHVPEASAESWSKNTCLPGASSRIAHVFLNNELLFVLKCSLQWKLVTLE